MLRYILNDRVCFSMGAVLVYVVSAIFLNYPANAAELPGYFAILGAVLLVSAGIKQLMMEYSGVNKRGLF